MLYKLGAQLEGTLTDNKEQSVVGERVYHFALRWDECELEPGVYTFPAWAFDTITRLNAKLGVGNWQLIIGLKCTPAFYSLPPHARNSPPTEANYAAFARFAEAAYMVFQPYAIEIYNEPEFTVLESAKNPEFYGGWGSDGAGYGQLVRITHDYLHTKSVSTQVIAGASFGFVDRTRAMYFLSRAATAGMKSDYWSWHGYKKYYDVMVDNRKFREYLSFSWEAQAIYDVPQVISEVSLLRDTERPELQAHRDHQAELLSFLLEHRDATCIESILWYTLADNGWMHSDMVNGATEWPVYGVWKEYE